MTPRENMLSLYRRQGYAFAPVEFNLSPTMREKMRVAAGEQTPGEYFDYECGFAQCAVPGPRLIADKSIDWRRFYPEPLHAETAFSAYGAAREGGRKGTYHLNRMHHPMAAFDSLAQMQAYPWPQWDFDEVAPMRAVVEGAQRKGVPTIGNMACTIWETAWGIRDMTQLMMDMATEDEKAVFILDKITDDAVGRASAYARAGVDLLHLGDDIGMQSSVMMSLGMYREWLKPRLGKVISAAKEAKPDILIFYHSCGYIEPYIPDLIEVGIDILNPVQPESMEFAKLHAEYGQVLSFNGTLGTQTTLPFGSPAEVQRVVRTNLDIAGSAGGLVVAPTHVVEPEVPWENVEAYVCACREYRPG